MGKQQDLILNTDEKTHETYFVEDYDSAIEVELNSKVKIGAGKSLLAELEDLANDAVRQQLKVKNDELKMLRQRCNKLESCNMELQDRLDYSLDGFMILEQDLENKIQELMDKEELERDPTISDEVSLSSDKKIIKKLLDLRNEENKNSLGERCFETTAEDNIFLNNNIENELQNCKDSFNLMKTNLQQQVDSNKMLVKSKEDLALKMQISEITIKELKHLLDLKVSELKAAEKQLEMLKNPAVNASEENFPEQQTLLKLKIIERAMQISVLSRICRLLCFISRPAVNILEKTSFVVPDKCLQLIQHILTKSDDVACYYLDTLFHSVYSLKVHLINFYFTSLLIRIIRGDYNKNSLVLVIFEEQL